MTSKQADPGPEQRHVERALEYLRTYIMRSLGHLPEDPQVKALAAQFAEVEREARQDMAPLSRSVFIQKLRAIVKTADALREDARGLANLNARHHDYGNLGDTDGDHEFAAEIRERIAAYDAATEGIDRG